MGACTFGYQQLLNQQNTGSWRLNATPPNVGELRRKGGVMPGVISQKTRKNQRLDSNSAICTLYDAKRAVYRISVLHAGVSNARGRPA
jgi:hypothetical protein